MPKPTFFNLPQDKRSAILDTAMAEFAEHDYQSASISRMVAHLGIAKGSFYQYFQDKDDLYLYVLDLAMRERLAYLSAQVTPDAQADLFAYMQALIEAGLRFDLAHPHLGQIVYRGLFGGGPLREQIYSRLKTPLLEFQREALARGAASGEIAPDVDLDLAAHILYAIMMNIGSTIVERLRLDPERLMRGNLSDSEMAALRLALGQVVRIMRYGLSERSELL